MYFLRQLSALQKPLGQAGILGSPKREAKTKESRDAHRLSPPRGQAENILVGGRNKYWSRRQVLDESVNNMPLTKQEFFSKLRNCHKTESISNTHFYMQTHTYIQRERFTVCVVHSCGALQVDGTFQSFVSGSS